MRKNTGVNDKLALGYKLLKKHSVNSTNELLAIKDTLQAKLDDVLNISEAISQKDKQVNELFLRLRIVGRYNFG
jgi:DNA repair protein RecN (Recombination protein N)